MAWWFYEDQQYSVKRLIAAAGYPPEEITLRRHHVRPDASRLLAAAGPPRGHDDEPRRGVAVASRTTRASAARSSCAATTRSSRSSASRRTTTGRSTSGARGATAGSSRCASCRSGTPSSPPPRCAATRHAACARSRSRSCRRGSGCRASTPGYWEPFFQACAETGTVVAMHIGSGTKTVTTSEDAPDAVQATNIFANSAVSLVDYLYSGVLVRHPDLKLLYAEAQIGWIPFVLERIDDVWETHQGWSHSKDAVERAAVVVLLPPGHQLLLQGQRRPRPPRPRRAPQHRVRDRLPAPGRHLAQHAPGGQGAVRPPRRPDGASTSCAATPSVCSASRVWATAAVPSRSAHPR